jgi:hypothetical protein
MMDATYDLLYREATLYRYKCLVWFASLLDSFSKKNAMAVGHRYYFVVLECEKRFQILVVAFSPNFETVLV